MLENIRFTCSNTGRTLNLPGLAFVATTAIALIGCGDNLDLDDQLEDSLTEAADNGSLAFFTMPASDDLDEIPQDPMNPSSVAKVDLGRLLYHETALGTQPRHVEGQGTYSCSSCHHAAAGFQAGVVQGMGDGGSGFGLDGSGRVPDPSYPIMDLDVQPIRTPTSLNGAYQESMLWNGQFGATGPNVGTEDRWTDGTPIAVNKLGYQGLEVQAIAGLSVHRMSDIPNSIAASNTTYTDLFEQAFPGEPIDTERAGLAIAAYERTLLANEAPFQRWLRGERDAMSDAQKRGALVFFGKAECVACHTGPALNSMTFHALGMEDMDPDLPGVYGDIPVDEGASLGRGGFTAVAADNFKFKTPQLYNLIDSSFHGHGGSFTTVRQVVEYKNQAQAARQEAAGALADEFVPLDLEADELTDLVEFIENGLYDPDLTRYVPDELPSGNCFPVNDSQSITDLGCQNL